ncbi:hypothetical protein KKC22_13520 [Myxococcota bacterium]|nr:hypothetical protein [Myxococcota bacterium]
MPAKPVVIWVALVTGLWLALACESAVKRTTDAGPDAGPDVTADVPVDVSSDADADVSWPPESPDQFDITTRSTSAFTAHYPYVYYHFVEYNVAEDLHDSFLYAFHVKTGSHQLLAHYQYNPQPELLSVNEDAKQMFWVATKFYRTGMEFPEFRKTYHLMRLSLETHELTEVPTAPFYTPNCERYNGRMYLYSYEPRSGWMVLQCTYKDPVGIRYDSWRANTKTGELQFIVNGQDRFAFFGDNPYKLGSSMITGRTTNWIEFMGSITKGPPIQLEIWETDVDVPRMVFSQEFPENTLCTGRPLNMDGWLTYSQIDENTQRIVSRAFNIWTMAEFDFPSVFYNQFQANQVSSQLPFLWVWIDAGTRVTFYGDVVMPSSSTMDIVLWDQERDIQRRVTAGDRLYSVPFLMPGEDPPRTLVYRSSDSHTENIRLHLRDLIAAGIMDETGHLLPAP